MSEAEGNLRINRRYAIVPHSPDTVEIRQGVWNPASYLLNDDSRSGKLFRALERLDGTASPATIAHEIGVPREEIEELVDHLDQLGILESGPTNALDYYLDNVVPTIVGPEPVGSSHAARSLVLIGEESLTGRIGKLLREVAPDVEFAPEEPRATEVIFKDDISWIFEGLAFYDKMQVFEPWKNSFVLMSSGVINPLQYKVLNRAALEHGFPWMHAAIDGPFLLIGPIFVPNRSPCYECFEQRVTMNLRDGASYVAYKEALVKRQIKRGQMPIEPLLQSMLASHAAMEIVNFTKTGYSFVVGKVLSVFLPTMEFAYNEVLRVPSCPARSPVSERDDTELYFDVTTLIDGGRQMDSHTVAASSRLATT